MSDRFFLDTNIFAYSFDKTASAKAQTSSALIRKAVETRSGVVSYQVVQEFFNVAFRRFAQPMLYAEAEQYLSLIFRPLLAVSSSQALYAHALQLTFSHKLAWYDSLIVVSALESECTILYSEDFQNGRRFGGLRVENPFV